MVGTKGKEALLYRKMPASAGIGIQSNEIQAMDAKTSGWKLLGNIYTVTKNIETILKYCLLLRLLNNHLLIHMGQSSP